MPSMAPPNFQKPRLRRDPTLNVQSFSHNATIVGLGNSGFSAPWMLTFKYGIMVPPTVLEDLVLSGPVTTRTAFA